MSALAQLRVDLDVPQGFPAEAVAAAEASRDRHLDEREDARHLPLVAIDPIGARDLDQAFHIERDGSGWLLHYAIADVGAVVEPGGPVDVESWKRGTTLYLPDGAAPLHPTVLSEGSASLLPGEERAAVLWRIRFDQRGERTGTDVRRARVVVKVATSYEVIDDLAGGPHAEARALAHELAPDLPSGIDLQEPRSDVSEQALARGVDLVEVTELLRELGTLRLAREVERGGVSLQMPEQDVVVGRSGEVRLVSLPPLAVEDWNAQLSLSTGMAAADLMLDAGVGLLRTLPPPDEGVLADLRLRSESLGHPWPADRSYPAWVRSLDVGNPVGLALSSIAGQGLRGSGYASFDGTAPQGADARHAAVAAPYAHVTAPLRRLGDRYAAEIALAASAGREVPTWVKERLEALPKVLGSAGQRAGTVDRAVVDLLEAAVLAPRVGEELDAVVLSLRNGGARVQVVDPPVVADAEAAEGDDAEAGAEAAQDDGRDRLSEGTSVRVRVIEADPITRTTRFGLA